MINLSKILLLCYLILAVDLISAKSPEDDEYRILHVMSYHSSWKWNKEQFNGFKLALNGIDVQYKVVELNTKRNSDPATINEIVGEARRIIDEWKPHLIYANDDNAQKYLAQEYVNTEIPIVFSGVNRDPSEYGYLGADNVTGVLEQEHFVATINLLKKLSPNVHRIAVIVDGDPTWNGVMSRIRNSLRYTPDIEITEWALVKTRSQFESKILELQNNADAIAMLGVFNIKGRDGKDTDYEQILRWVAENSNLPDFSFWQTRVERGTLCAVAVSGYEQGYLAVEMARKILLDRISPSDLPIKASKRGLPMINLARARSIGIKPDVNLNAINLSHNSPRPLVII